MNNYFAIYNLFCNQPGISVDTAIIFDDCDPKILEAISKANIQIWDEYDFKFKESNMQFNTIAGQAAYSHPYGTIVKNGVKINNNISLNLELESNPETLLTASNTPSKYYIEYNLLNLYPTPDDIYPISVKFLTLKRAVDQSGNLIDNLKLETDILNIPQQAESVYLQCLLIKSIINYIADPTDETYNAYAMKYNEALKILKLKTSGLQNTPKLVI